MLSAVWVDCPGITNEGKQAHAMRDGCTSCAPFWGRIPVCPHCRHKLHRRGRTKCKGCNKYSLVNEEQ